MRTLLIAFLLLLAAAPVPARDVAGVTVPDAVDADGTKLQLNGAALRTRFFFQVYVAALYVDHPTHAADEIIAAKTPRRVDLHILRALDAKEISSAIAEGFERNTKDMGPLRERLDRFTKMFPSVQPGDIIALTCNGERTEVAHNGKSMGSITGADFGSALLAVWLGPDPVDSSVKQGLLGG